MMLVDDPNVCEDRSKKKKPPPSTTEKMYQTCGGNNGVDRKLTSPLCIGLLWNYWRVCNDHVNLVVYVVGEGKLTRSVWRRSDVDVLQYTNLKNIKQMFVLQIVGLDITYELQRQVVNAHRHASIYIYIRKIRKHRAKAWNTRIRCDNGRVEFWSLFSGTWIVYARV